MMSQMNYLTSDKICDQVYASIKKVTDLWQSKPHLAVILVGEHPASLRFIAHKKKQASLLGFGFSLINLSSNCLEEEVYDLINLLNKDKKVSGILIQLPLPKSFNTWQITQAIDPNKDVDCLGAFRMGQFLINAYKVLPGTAQAIRLLCNHYNISVIGRNVLIIGSSNLVGKPAAIWFSQQEATVTISNLKTTNLEQLVKNNTIIVCATGAANAVNESWLNRHHIIIDIGTRIKNSKVYGDLNHETASKIANQITPVPGGIGPLTVAALMMNLTILNPQYGNNDEIF